MRSLPWVCWATRLIFRTEGWSRIVSSLIRNPPVDCAPSLCLLSQRLGIVRLANSLRMMASCAETSPGLSRLRFPLAVCSVPITLNQWSQTGQWPSTHLSQMQATLVVHVVPGQPMVRRQELHRPSIQCPGGVPVPARCERTHPVRPNNMSDRLPAGGPWSNSGNAHMTKTWHDCRIRTTA